ncbi:plasma membrane proteolipid 3 [Diutina catenulata]
MHAKDWFLVFIGFFFPFVPVMVKRGVCSSDTLLNILLCLLGWFPGVIHCYYIIATYPEEDGPYIEIVDDNYGSV